MSSFGGARTEGFTSGGFPAGMAPARSFGTREAAVRAPGGPRRLNAPIVARVRVGPGGRPLAVDARAVEAVRESWLVEDRWWTDAPLRRRYWEVVTDDGKNLVVFRDLVRGTWYRQR